MWHINRKLQIKSTCFHRWSTATFEELAELHNPRIKGWINYYGKYRKYEMKGTFQKLNIRLEKWVRNRYKRFGARKRKSFKYLKRICNERPMLFAHWKSGFKV